MVVVAHLTDPHLDGGETARRRFLDVASWLRDFQTSLAAIVLSGDIIVSGATEEYAIVRDALDGIAPLIACPGNSDVRVAFREAFPAPGSTGGDPVNSVLETDGLAVVALDGQVPQSLQGHLDESTVNWARRTLDAIDPATPVLIALHYPPVNIGHERIDGLKLDNPEVLADLIVMHPNVVATLAGHSHSATVTTFAGKPFVIAPGIFSTMRLPGEVTEANPAMMDEVAPPSLAMHLIEDGVLTTHFRTIV